MSVTTSSSSVPYAMSSAVASTAATVSSGSACCGQGGSCTCPACQSLATPVRPLFFAGQVLTEVDLMALENYAMGAHRMHNRYLHGPGVVCGLDLACEDCGDGITVCPGYALDPCGRDLVVPTTQAVDVGALISACLAAERGAVPACDPPMPPAPKGCDTAQEWCLTLRYKEIPMRPVTPLAASRSSSGTCGCGCSSSTGGSTGTGSGGCGCGCGGSTPIAGWSCTCGQSGSRSTQACGCTSYVAAADLPPGCEPTRVAECFEFGVCRCDGACCSARSVLANTFWTHAAQCVTAIRPLLSARLNKRQQLAMMTTALGSVSDTGTTQTGLCSLLQAVIDVYQSNPCRLICQLPAELQQIDCSAQGANETDEGYSNRLINGTQLLVGLVVAYLRDCLCHALNPPCPDGCDDRIILGCFTYDTGKVTEICNLECRQYAGSFVSSRYWLPVQPLAMWALGALCCFPLTGVKVRGNYSSFLARTWAAADPTGEMRKLVMQDDFALAKRWPAQARSAFAKLSPAALRDRFTPSPRAINLAALEGAYTGDAEEKLKAGGVIVKTVEVTNPDAVPISRVGVLGIVEPGASVSLYEYKGRVIYVGSEVAEPTQPSARAEG